MFVKTVITAHIIRNGNDCAAKIDSIEWIGEGFVFIAKIKHERHSLQSCIKYLKTLQLDFYVRLYIFFLLLSPFSLMFYLGLFSSCVDFVCLFCYSLFSLPYFFIWIRETKCLSSIIFEIDFYSCVSIRRIFLVPATHCCFCCRRRCCRRCCSNCCFCYRRRPSCWWFCCCSSPWRPCHRC